nr:HAD-IA family hydrolase [Sagittula salina]
MIEWQPERYYDARVGEARRRAMFAEVDLHGMNDLVDRGHDFRETIQTWAGKHPEWQAEIALWHDDWLEMAKPEIPHSVRLLRALNAKGMRTLALTNFGIGTWAIATPVYDFLGAFSKAYVSGHMGVAKPDPEIYRMVEASEGVSPEALLFTDDRAENIAAAEERGWQTHLFEGPEGWAARLVSEGLLSAAEAA